MVGVGRGVGVAAAGESHWQDRFFPTTANIVSPACTPKEDIGESLSALNSFLFLNKILPDFTNFMFIGQLLMCCAGPLMEMSVRNWTNVSVEASDIVYGNVAPPMTCMVTLNDFDMGSRPVGLVVFVLELLQVSIRDGLVVVFVQTFKFEADASRPRN